MKMETRDIIPVRQLCVHYEIPDSFFELLSSYELIETVRRSDEQCIPKSQIGKLEKIIRLHYELNINFEGLDVILRLQEQIMELQDEVNHLRNKLAFYTSD